MTDFCNARIPLWDDLEFFVDGNSKITASRGTFANPMPNAFSLPHISTCPGSTPACRASCYVHGLQRNAPDAYAKYALNAMALARVLPDWPRAERAAAILGAWIVLNCREFRWHVSGDVVSNRHAQWIVEVCKSAPDVAHWIYTRSLAYVPTLMRAENLAVNVSADRDNYVSALGVALKNGARLCYMAQSPDPLDIPDLPYDSVIFPDYPQRGRDRENPTSHPWWRGLNKYDRAQVCPADFFGQSEAHRCGPCRKCMVRNGE